MLGHPNTNAGIDSVLALCRGEVSKDVRVNPSAFRALDLRAHQLLSDGAADSRTRAQRDACVFFAVPGSAPYRTRSAASHTSGCSTFARTDALRFSAAASAPVVVRASQCATRQSTSSSKLMPRGPTPRPGSCLLCAQLWGGRSAGISRSRARPPVPTSSSCRLSAEGRPCAMGRAFGWDLEVPLDAPGPERNAPGFWTTVYTFDREALGEVINRYSTCVSALRPRTGSRRVYPVLGDLCQAGKSIHRVLHGADRPLSAAPDLSSAHSPI